MATLDFTPLSRSTVGFDHLSRVFMANGLLVIDLKRELPDALKPRRIAVRDASLSAAKSAMAAA